MSNKTFEGWYLKHQQEGRTLALIPGRSAKEAFVQVVTDEQSYFVSYPSQSYTRADGLQIGMSRFGPDGVTLNIHGKGIHLTGNLHYGGMTPIQSDIMGPFRFFPMECRHSVVSMNHRVEGRVVLNGETWAFDGGKGYIEGDSGRSFPKRYLWVQCNDFAEECSIMASVARIPFAGLRFWGCICVVWHGGKEYRLATYHGVKIVCMNAQRLELQQGWLRLLVEVQSGKGHKLPAPQKGEMKRVIHETPGCPARFLFMDGDEVVFHGTSEHAAFEFVE